MAAYIQRRLELMGDKVIQGNRVCQGLVDKVRHRNSLSDADRTEIGKLKISMARLIDEMKNYTYQHLGPPSEDMEEMISDLTAVCMKADDILVELELITPQSSVEGGQIESFSTEVADSARSTNITSRLPKLDLPKFDGNVLNWHEFWSKFTASVDGRRDLRDVDKLTYLQISVQDGSAKDLIAGLATTNETYKIAIDTLMDEYGEEGIVIDAHYTALFDVSKANGDVGDNKRVLTEVDRHLRILDAMGENTGQNNALRAMIVSKFSENVQSNLRMKMRPTQGTVKTIMSALKEIIKALEHPSALISNQNGTSRSSFTTEAHCAYDSKIQQRSQPTWNKKRKPGLHSEQRAYKRPKTSHPTLKASSKEDSESVHPGNSKSKSQSEQFTTSHNNPASAAPKKQRTCIFCDGNHSHDLCDRYTTLKQRRGKLQGRCFLCLRPNHSVKECKFTNIKCSHCNKQGHHNRCLCPTKYGYGESGTHAMFSQMGYDTILQTVLAPIRSSSGTLIKAKVLFDCGSQRSYIHSSLAKRLKMVPLENTCLTVFTFGTTKPRTIPADLVSFRVQTKDHTTELTAFAVPSTTGLLPSHTEFKTKLRENFSHFDFAEDSEKDQCADIIIGNDYYYEFIKPERKAIAEKLYMVNTTFGWIPSGSYLDDIVQVNHQLAVLTYIDGICACSKEDLFVRPDPAIRNDDIKMLWELEAIGISDPPKVIQDEEVVEYFNKTTKFEENRYYVKWPWVEYPPDLPLNFGLALGRLKSLLRRLNVEQRRRYNDVLVEQYKKHIIEEVTDRELPKSHPVHYLPHHCVIQEHKSTKLRIVYDASSKIKGHCSLNELLYKGPLMLEDLTSLLLKFRVHSVGIVADIEKAFLQVGLQNTDRDVTRFLWVRDVNDDPSGDNLVHLRFCRVPFGIISSPFLLAATIRHHILCKNMTFAQTLANSLYVDNLITGVEYSHEAHTLYHTAKQTFEELSMNLRGWNSNDKSFLNSLPESQRDTSRALSVLGMTWDTVDDRLRLAFMESKLDKPATSKRTVLKIIASVFDPCGYIAPLTLPTRVFLQNLWEKGLNWDTPLSPDQSRTWNTCVEYLKRVPQFSTTRRYVTLILHRDKPIELHCFTDASQDAYVAIVFIRVDQEVSYIISRSRVTPLKRKEHLTIPKLELLAAVIGTRLLSYVQKSLDFKLVTSYLWTDSRTVLGWLHTERLLPPWVSRRVGEIHKTKDVLFRYVPSAVNPADVATRPLKDDTIPDCWFNGPGFLHQPTQHWPSQWSDDAHADDILDLKEEQNMESPPDQYKTQALANTATSIQTSLPTHGSILPLHAILDLQRIHFTNEFSGKTTQLSKTLGIFKDPNGILRCKGRYQNADLPYDQRCPILLPKEADLTAWVIRRVHDENYHVGVPHTLSLLRQAYWIPQGRSAVTKVLKRCPNCVKYGGGPFRLPDMPDLPKERVSYNPPFTYTGLDYLGPLVILEQGKKCKRWVCLFTCMAVRAIHLEVVQDATADEFILCLRRFVSTRGAPRLVLSDNALQFKLAATLVASPVVQRNNIDWRFITELSPWQGGLYERLVGLVKHCLLRTVNKKLLTDSQLRTVMKEIESVLNTRPLTTVGPEHSMVLTPSHFLSTCGLPYLLPPDQEPDCFRTDIRRKLVDGWKKSRVLLEGFKQMFINQYLLSLRERHTPTHKQPRILSYREPRLGDVVQIKGDSRNRAVWKVGTITDFGHGVDGKVRSARVTLDNGMVVTRSVGHLYPLELDVDHSESPVIPPKTGPQPSPGPATATASAPDPDTPLVAPPVGATLSPPAALVPDTSHEDISSSRPRRAAFLQGLRKLRQWTANLFSLASSKFS